MARGTVFMHEWEAKRMAERESVRVTARCANCPWTLEGTVQATREAFLAHRTTKHPEVVPRPRRKRHRPLSALQGLRSLDDNIAAARAQGAAGWAGAE